MRLRSLIIFVLSAFMLVLAEDADAQRRNKYKKRRQTNRKISHYKGGVRGYGRFKPYYFIGANINAGNYFGDLAPVNKAASTDISFTRPGFGIHGGYKFHHSIAVRAALNYYRVFGDDFSADPATEDGIARYSRNLSFRNDIKEFQVGVEISLLPNYGGVDQRLPVNAYLFIGGAVFLHDPKGKVPDADYQTDINGGAPAPQAGEWVSLRDLGTEGQNLGVVEPYSKLEISVPIAVGATLRIPRSNFNAGIEFGMRYLFTDYIDDVSTNYVDLSRFDDDLARIMSDRSTVPTSSSGDARDLTNVNINQGNGTHNFFYAVDIGAGSDGAKRGNPDNNDFIFVSQIKLTYLLSSAPKRSAKFR